MAGGFRNPEGLTKKQIMARSEARRFRVAKLRESGMTLAAIGKVEGVSPPRVRQLLARHKRMQARGNDGEEAAG